MEKMNLFQRMAGITAELGTVAKNLNVQTGKGKSYKAVSERDIIDAVKPLEAKYGVYSYPYEREVVESQILESETEYGKKTTFFERVRTTYVFVNVDDPMDRITMVTFAEGLDSGDKASGKAMTYGDKYALMKAYKISTGDDPDEQASEDRNYTRYGAKSAARRADAPQVKCERCGRVITPYATAKGTQVSTEAHAARSKEKFGHVYCLDCISVLKDAQAQEELRHNEALREAQHQAEINGDR